MTPIIDRNEQESGQGFKLSDENNLKIKEQCVLCMCQLPGRINGKWATDKGKYQTDLQNLKDSGITDILCLLSENELRATGIEIEDYKRDLEKANIKFHNYPIIEMTPPTENPESLKNGLISKLEAIIKGKKSRVAVHCLAGVGRAGTIVCCLLLHLGIAKNPSEAI